MTLNGAKTNFLVFSNKRVNGFDCLRISQNLCINRVQSIKLLGIIIDDKLKFAEHGTYVLKRIQSGIFNMQCCINKVPPHIKLQIYYSFVYSHLQYCSEIWGINCPAKIKNQLHVKQNNCIRCIKKLSRFANVSSYYRELKLLKFDDIVKKNAMKIMFKIENSLCPKLINNLFKKGNHDHNTRDKHYSYQGKNIFLETLFNHWKKLPINIKTTLSLPTFKKKVNEFIINNY